MKHMNTNALRRNAPWLLVAAVPVAGYLIYRNLTPHQKRKFKKSFFEGVLTLATTLLSRVTEEYKRQRGQPEPPEANAYRLSKMAMIPNRDESETTIGDEKW